MTTYSDYSTWGRAAALWFWANMGGMLGIILTLMLTNKNYSPVADARLQVTIGLIAALVSLPVILSAYIIFRMMLPIRTRTGRLLATAGAITAAFAATLLLACLVINEPGFFAGGFAMGGWAYLLTALVVSAIVYSPVLLRPDDLPYPDGPANASA